LTPQKIKNKNKSSGFQITDRQTQKEDVPSPKPLRLAIVHQFMKMPLAFSKTLASKANNMMSLLSILSFSITLEQQSKSSTRVATFFRFGRWPMF